MIVLVSFSAFANGKKDKSLLEVGSAAPDFTLPSHNGETISLSSFIDRQAVVLIFYPGDQTPVCTQQLCEIRDDYSQFQSNGAVVFGVNPGDVKSHENFAGKHSFQFPLLIDQKAAVTKLYGSKGGMVTKRTVYVIDKHGTIVYAQRGKPPVSDILAHIPR
jgi:peroxiredoxin Q/BCP